MLFSRLLIIKELLLIWKSICFVCGFKVCILYREEEVVDGRSYVELCFNYGYKISYLNFFRIFC